MEWPYVPAEPWRVYITHMRCGTENNVLIINTDKYIGKS
jgi:hypothetical protein